MSSTRPVALVTGASAGIGEEFARQLAHRGHDVVLVARSRDALERLAKELEAEHGANCEVRAADLTNPSDLAAVAARVKSVDVLVNNAGYGTFGRFDELDLDREINEIELNVVALVRLTHAAAGAMVERGRGGILNVSSLASRQPGPHNATYAASKAFVTSFTEAVHEDLKGTGVAVTALLPGFTRTNFQAVANVPGDDVPSFLWQSAEAVARTGLDGLAHNRAVVIPGAMYKTLGALSGVTPTAITRRLGGVVVKRTTKPGSSPP